MFWQWSRNLESKVSFSPTLDMDDFLPAILLLSGLPMDYDFSVAGGKKTRGWFQMIETQEKGNSFFILSPSYSAFSLNCLSFSHLSLLFPPCRPFWCPASPFKVYSFLEWIWKDSTIAIFVISQKVDEQTMEKHAVIISLVFLVKTATKMRENVL